MDAKLTELIPALTILIKKTSDAILEVYKHSHQFAITTKPDSSPLTQADLIAHETLIAGLQQLTPNWPILSEEGASIAFATRQQWSRYWLLDPLDGTKEFIRHSGDFAINIALIENNEAILGMIYAPVLDALYYAIKDQGAWQILSNALQPQRITVRKEVVVPIIAVGHFYKLEKLKAVLQHLGEFEMMPVGSALKFCYIAAGRADLYPRTGVTSEWDTAAGQIIVEEAGGAVLDFDFQPLRYNSRDSLLNPPFIAVGDKQILTRLANKFPRGKPRGIYFL